MNLIYKSIINDLIIFNINIIINKTFIDIMKCIFLLLSFYKHIEGNIAMHKTISFILSVILLLGLFLTTGCSNKQSTSEKIIVAMELAYPPFETKDNDGNPSGISVDFAKSFGEYIGKEVIIENIAWDGLTPSLQTGKADLIISSMTITDIRKEEVDFSNPYANSLLAILANKNSDVTTIDHLNKAGKKVVVKTGTTGFFYAQENLKNCDIISLADESACVMEVVQGKADGFIYDQLTVYRNNQNNLETTTAIFIPFQNVEHWGVAVKKGNAKLLNQMNDFIIKFKNEGGFENLTEKYLSEEKKAFDRMGFIWFFDLKE